MHMSCIMFIAKNITHEEICGKKVLELGSRDVNGSPRYVLQLLKPSEYIGVDIQKGKGVDEVCSVDDIVGKFGENAFDIVVSTELLEHVQDWKTAVSNLKKVSKPNGLLFITTRSKGFNYHGHPYDFWRYELEDFQTLFSDMEIIKLEKDSLRPGVFLKACKPKNFTEKDLSEVALHSMVMDQRIKLSDSQTDDFRVKLEKVLVSVEQKAKRKLRKAKIRHLRRQVYNLGKRLVFRD